MGTFDTSGSAPGKVCRAALPSWGRWILLGALALSGCRCGPDRPVAEIRADGTALVYPGELGALVPGELLVPVARDGEERGGSSEGLGRVRLEVLDRIQGEARVARVWCAGPGGIAAGRYVVARPGAGRAPDSGPGRDDEPLGCERWAEVVSTDPQEMKTAGPIPVEEGGLLRAHVQEGEREITVWARVGARASEPGRFGFDVLLPVDAPELPIGLPLDLSLPASGTLEQLMAKDAAWLMSTTLTNAREAAMQAGSSPDEQVAVAKLFELADRTAIRGKAIIEGLQGSRANGSPGLATAGSGGEVSSPPSPDDVWRAWVDPLLRAVELPKDRTPGMEAIRAHLPTLRERAEKHPGREDDLSKLESLLRDWDHRREAAEAEVAPGPREPRRRKEARKEEPGVEYLPMAELPEELKVEYRHIRAIPVNPDPAAFADRAPEEIREEQVEPVLEHARGFLEHAAELVKEQQKAPEPVLTCRVLFALDNVERGQKVYRSTDEDVKAAAALAGRISRELLREGRRECFRMMRRSSFR